MLQVQQTCTCGKKYWPSQKWIHESCGVVNHQETVTTATNDCSVVVNRSKDRHRKTPERAAYQREYMKAYRKRRELAKG